MRSIARTARGPSRAPARLVTPRSIGTPTSAASRPTRLPCCTRVGAQRRVEQGRDALVGLRPPIGAGEHLLDDLAEFGIVRLARCSGRHIVRAGSPASCCPSRRSIGAASRSTFREQRLPRSFPRLHAGTYLPVVIRDCPRIFVKIAHKKKLLGARLDTSRQGYGSLGGAACHALHASIIFQSLRTASRRGLRPGAASVARLEARHTSAAGELDARQRIGAGAQSGDTARLHHRARHGPVHSHRLRHHRLSQGGERAHLQGRAVRGPRAAQYIYAPDAPWRYDTDQLAAISEIRTTTAAPIVQRIVDRTAPS